MLVRVAPEVGRRPDMPRSGRCSRGCDRDRLGLEDRAEQRVAGPRPERSGIRVIELLRIRTIGLATGPVPDQEVLLRPMEAVETGAQQADKLVAAGGGWLAEGVNALGGWYHRL